MVLEITKQILLTVIFLEKNLKQEFFRNLKLEKKKEHSLSKMRIQEVQINKLYFNCF